MAHPLDDAWTKFNRAKVHCHSLNRKISTWMNAQGNRPIFSIKLDEDASEGCFIVRVRRVKKLPRTWSLIVGDALFNFRASLDYLAWQLVQAGTQPNTERPERVYWPIIAKESDAMGAIDDRLPGILPKHRALVEECQPYKRSGLNPLSVLNELSRYDKHRRISVLSAANKDFKIVGRVRHFVVERTETPRPQRAFALKPGTELTRIFGRRTNKREPEMDMRFEGTMSIVFENNLWVLEVLKRVENRIGDILANFELLF